MILKFTNIRKSYFLFSILFILLLWLPSEVQAQEAQGKRLEPGAHYVLTSESTTFIPLSGGTVVPNISANNTVSTALPIGFNFNIGFTSYSTFFVSSNGFITFNSTNYATTPKLNVNPALAPLWADLTGQEGVFSYKTTGVAPNRVLTAEWNNWGWNHNARKVISFQVKMYEGTNSVEYIYKQEPNAIAPGSNAAIGIFSGAISENKQLWLADPSATPVTSTTLINPIATKPAEGQLYRFVFDFTTNYYGQTVINPMGGTNENDGLSISLSGTGTMQIKRNGTRQIYSPNKEVPKGTTDPYEGTGTINGLVLSVGTSFFAGGTLVPSEYGSKLIMVSSTAQSKIESPAGSNHFENTIRMSATKGGLVYYLDVKYTYEYPESSVLVDYTVTIPAGNTEKVQLAHGWDTYLSGNDRGPGFVSGTAPYYVVGVIRTPSYEAFQYKGGVPWSGYFSALFGYLDRDLLANTTPFMTFINRIDPSSDVDNGIGISMDFGSIPGSHTSNNALVFSCEAGDVPPTLTAATVKPCTGASFDLNSYITSVVPPGTRIVWKKGKTIIDDPSNVTVDGTYTVSFYSPLYNCYSPEATLKVIYDNSCAVCYKPAVTTGVSEPVKTIISTLDRESVPRDLNDYRTGSLILESKTKGFVLTRMASPETAIPYPIEGMLVYDTSINEIKLYNGTVWKVLVQSCPD